MLTFNYENDCSWNQASADLLLKGIPLEEFTNGRKLYLKKCGLNDWALLGKALRGKRGFGLPGWTCYHVAEYVVGDIKKLPNWALPLHHFGSFLLQDPIFPLGFLGASVKNAWENSGWGSSSSSTGSSSAARSQQETAARRSERSGRGIRVSGVSAAAPVVSSTTGEHEQPDSSSCFGVDWRRCTHSSAEFPGGRSRAGASTSRASKMRCANKHKFCLLCVRANLSVRGIPLDVWRARFTRVLCPHPTCYCSVKIDG